MNLRYQIEYQYLFIQMKSHFKLTQEQDHHYASPQIFSSKYKFFLSQLDKLYYHIDLSLEYLEIEIRQELSRKRTFSTNALKSEVII